jgi:DNA-binding response OmpR family regulator
MHIVVASANIFRRELSVYVLGEAGHQVSEAYDIVGLLASLRHQAPDLLIIDTVIPGGDIPDLLPRLRALGPPPILWLAHSGRDAAAHLAMEGWPHDVIPWPYHPDELIRRVERLGTPRLATAIALGAPLHQHVMDTPE